MKKYLPQNKFNLILIIGVLLLVVGGFIVVKNFVLKSSEPQDTTQIEEIDVTFDPEGPYIVLVPRKDGKAVMVNLKRIATYDAFSYQIAYTDNLGIDRGAGDLNTWAEIEEGKTDYEKEILFGSCSKNVCKYDEGVENGTLNLHLKQGNKVFKFITKWHLVRPEVVSGGLISGDGHFTYATDPKSKDLELIGFTIINDLSGAPKIPPDKMVLGTVYSVNTPSSVKQLPEGKVILELAEAPKEGSKLAVYIESENRWQELNTQIDDTKLMAPSDVAGIFAVLAPK